MNEDTLYVVKKPLHDKLYEVIGTGEASPAFIVDADSEHYVNRKILSKLSSKVTLKGHINFICDMHSISSVLTCVKELDEGEGWGAHVTTFSFLDFQDPIFLVRIHYASNDGFTLIPSVSKVLKTSSEIYDRMADIILHNTLEKDSVICIGQNATVNFIDPIKNSCRYFVGITSSVNNEDIFIDQGVSIDKRI